MQLKNYKKWTREMQNLNSGLVVVFMRHGDYNRSSGEITRLGEDNIHSMAEKLKGEYNIHPSIIATSPKLRGIQSAKVAAAVFSRDLITRDPIQIEELDEKYGAGQFAQQHLRKIPDGKPIICLTHDTTIMGNVVTLLPTMEEKMKALSKPPKVDTSDALIVRIDGERWDEAGERPVTCELVHH
jgi:broad specificity phosphatase PhoE